MKLRPDQDSDFWAFRADPATRSGGPPGRRPAAGKRTLSVSQSVTGMNGKRRRSQDLSRHPLSGKKYADLAMIWGTWNLWRKVALLSSHDLDFSYLTCLFAVLCSVLNCCLLVCAYFWNCRAVWLFVGPLVCCVDESVQLPYVLAVLTYFLRYI